MYGILPANENAPPSATLYPVCAVAGLRGAPRFIRRPVPRLVCSRDGNHFWLVRWDVPFAAVPTFPVRADNDHWAALFALQSAVAVLGVHGSSIWHSTFQGLAGGSFTACACGALTAKFVPHGHSYSEETDTGRFASGGSKG